jgi:PAS domain S-box-containing protein
MDVTAATETAAEPMRVLVVDDDEFDRRAVRRALQQSGISATIDEASSASEAIARLAPGAYDCVLLDYYLPGVDTRALLQQMRAAAEDVPIVVFTGRGDEDIAVEFMKAGAVDYLPKASLTPERLTTSFRYALEMTRTAAARRQAEQELREQESRFRTLANAIPQLAWIADAEGSIHWYNQRWYDYTGTTLEQMQGWGWQAAHHPGHVQRVVERIRRSFETGDPWEDTFPLRGRDGEYRWFLSRAVPMRRSDGSITGWFGTNTDVTEQIEAERMLREREAEFRTLANAIPQLAWIADADGRRYWFNDRWYEYTGLRPDQCVGLGWQLVHHPDHRERVCNGQLAAFRAQFEWEDTHPLHRADGEYRWFLSRAMPIKDREGRVLRWIGTNTDISERLESEHALAASEERFRRALAIETVGVIFFTVTGEITGANDAFLRMAGFTRADVEAGRVRWDELTAPEFMPQSLRAVEEFKATGRTTPYEKQYIRPDGTRWWALFAATQLNDREGVEFVVDLTASKAVEQEREALLDRERRTRKDAERATKVRDEVLAILAHDLRSPLQAVLGAATMLTLTADEDKRQHRFKLIERNVRSMERLVTDLLDVARIEAGTFMICKERVDARTLINEAVELCEPQAATRDIALGAEMSDDLKPILADRDRLLQVLSNLLGNALKFSDAGTKVVVRATNTDGGVRISVKDSGHGISQDALPHVFDRFWQVDRTSRSGAGLGLAICKGIVEAHGGRIWAASAVGRGTTFHFEIAEYPTDAGAGIGEIVDSTVYRHSKQ